MNALDKDIQTLIGKPIEHDELAEMSRIFIGAMKCLTVCLMEARNESRHINESINERTGRGTQPSGSKYTPFRLCETQRPDSHQIISDHREFNAREA
ncbi:MAG: hypothetical protein IKN71_03580 [Alphaproteobacteria bacterium]|nr:hypothetical protein [Alphaproteobacteria bacterium]